MAITTLSKGESYTFTRTGDITTLVGSSDHAHGTMRVSNNLYMSASSTITHTIDSSANDSNIHFKTSAGSFKLGYDNSAGVFNLRTGTGDYGGSSVGSTTVFQVSTGNNIMYVPNALHVSTGFVASESIMFKPKNMESSLAASTYKSGSTGLLGIGWNGYNGSAGYGEIDFYSMRGAGATADGGGGFAFYDLPRNNDTGYLLNNNYNGNLICRLLGPTANNSGGPTLMVPDGIISSSLVNAQQISAGPSPNQSGILYVNRTLAFQAVSTEGASTGVIFKNSGSEFSFGIQANGPNKALYIQARGQNKDIMLNPAAGTVLIGGINPPTTTYKLDVLGLIRTTGNVTTSDKRLKQDILPIENALDKILMLNGVTYNWNKEFDPDKNLDDDNHIGLLAQDVEKIIPQIVSTDDSKHQLKSMTYTELIPVLIEAIKEQQTQINELKNKLKDTPYG